MSTINYQQGFLGIKPTGVALKSGVMLVSVPFYNDENFNRTVVLLIDHSDEGAVGLIVNKRTNVRVCEAVPSWRVEDKMAFGGPVMAPNIIVLHNHEGGGKYNLIRPGLYSGIDPILLSIIEHKASNTLKYKFFLGYSGWAAGQLESELERGMWVVMDYQPDLLFDTPRRQVWETAVRNLGPDYLHWLDLPEWIAEN